MAAELQRTLMGMAKSRVAHEMIGSERERKRRGARSADVILAWRQDASVRRRIRYFAQLWWINAKSRDLLISNLLFLLATTSIARQVGRYTTSATSEEGEEKRFENLTKTNMQLPKELRRMTPDQLINFANLLEVILKHDTRSQVEWRKVGIDYAARALSYQAAVALLETILQLTFADKHGKQPRENLVKLAEKVGVEDTKKKNMDQLRIEASKGIVDLVKNQVVRSE